MTFQSLLCTAAVLQFGDGWRLQMSCGVLWKNVSMLHFLYHIPLLSCGVNGAHGKQLFSIYHGICLC